MSELNASIAADVVAACQTNAVEAAQALQRGLDGEFTLAVGEPCEFSSATTPAEWEGPGLAVVFQLAGVGAALWIPESSGLLPAWYQTPDATGTSKLGALAQELSMLLLPESLMADRYAAAGVSQLSAALASLSPADDAQIVPLTATRGDVVSEWRLIWPLAQPDQLPVNDVPSAPAPSSAAPQQDRPEPSHKSNPPSRLDVKSLPVYSRSLLKIGVPVSVELAHKREVIKEIVELAPGTILKFDKSCDELLRLFVGGQPIAEGEAVKVGDKFGFRVCSMLLPRERFQPIRTQGRSAS